MANLSLQISKRVWAPFSTVFLDRTSHKQQIDCTLTFASDRDYWSKKFLDASCAGDLDWVRAILDMSIEIDAKLKNERGHDSLTCALDNKHSEVAGLLMSQNRYPFSPLNPTADGLSALEWAVGISDPKLIKLLFLHPTVDPNTVLGSKGNPVSTILLKTQTSAATKMDVLKSWISSGRVPRLDLSDSAGEDVIMALLREKTLSASDLIAVLSLLLPQGSSLSMNHLNHDGDGYAHFIAWKNPKNGLALMKWFLSIDPNLPINIVDNSMGSTPLAYARRNAIIEHDSSLLDFLVSRGALEMANLGEACKAPLAEWQRAVENNEKLGTLRDSYDDSWIPECLAKNEDFEERFLILARAPKAFSLAKLMNGWLEDDHLAKWMTPEFLRKVLDSSPALNWDLQFRRHESGKKCDSVPYLAVLGANLFAKYGKNPDFARTLTSLRPPAPKNAMALLEQANPECYFTRPLGALLLDKNTTAAALKEMLQWMPDFPLPLYRIRTLERTPTCDITGNFQSLAMIFNRRDLIEVLVDGPRRSVIFEDKNDVSGFDPSFTLGNLFDCSESPVYFNDVREYPGSNNQMVVASLGNSLVIRRWDDLVEKVLKRPDFTPEPKDNGADSSLIRTLIFGYSVSDDESSNSFSNYKEPEFTGTEAEIRLARMLLSDPRIKQQSIAFYQPDQYPSYRLPKLLTTLDSFNSYLQRDGNMSIKVFDTPVEGSSYPRKYFSIERK